MKQILVLSTFAFISSSIVCSYSSSGTSADSSSSSGNFDERFCALSADSKVNFRSCLIENGLEIENQLFKNCAQRVKFFPTLLELDEYLCKIRNTQKYEKYAKCFNSAKETLSLSNPNVYPISSKCLTQVENCQRKSISSINFYQRSFEELF
ncbi:uncharacterized protein LOC111627603 [Centruroides sculpturatus]|uniref:uncharacterized protein LOC111627603 n=1 Tax=Centruroides sculpturatus TaxID=218467 RepID=UPI000C6EEDB9|nr:uncharacterized protein LOC111627603 [Centruroides sculpturatus]